MTNDEAKQLIQDIGAPWTGRLELAAWYRVLQPWDFNHAVAHATSLLTTKPASKIGPADFNRETEHLAEGDWSVEDAAWRSITTWAARTGGWREALDRLYAYPHDQDEAAAAAEVRQTIRYGKENDARWAFMRMLRSIKRSGQAAAIAARQPAAALPASDREATALLPGITTEEALANAAAVRAQLIEAGKSID